MNETIYRVAVRQIAYAALLAIAAFTAPAGQPSRAADDAMAERDQQGLSAETTRSRSLYEDGPSCALANVEIWLLENSFAYTFYVSGFEVVDSVRKFNDDHGATVLYRDERQREFLAKRRANNMEALPQRSQTWMA
jgi:hypothetical protein